MHFEVEKTSLGAEHGCGFGFSDECKAVVVFVAEETSLDGGSSCRGLASIIPNGGDGEEVPDVAFLSCKDLTQRLLQVIAHCLSQLEQVVGSDVDFRLSWWKWREVNRIDVCVSAQHQLQLEPFHLLYAWLGVACRGEGVGNVRAPSDDLLVLVVV